MLIYGLRGIYIHIKMYDMLIINGEILHYTMFNYPHVTVVAMFPYNEYASSEI